MRANNTNSHYLLTSKPALISTFNTARLATRQLLKHKRKPHRVATLCRANDNLTPRTFYLQNSFPEQQKWTDTAQSPSRTP